MIIDNTPSITFYELSSDPTVNGEGAKIPVIIGKTATATADPTKLLKFKNYDNMNRVVSKGGLIPDDDSTTENPVLNFVKDFFEEAKRTEDEQIGIPYIYVIDLGKEPKTEDFTKAMNTAKTTEDITVEIYVGTIDPAVMVDADTCLSEDVHTGNPRLALFAAGVKGATVEDMVKLTDETQTSFVQKSRVCLIEPDFFGKTCARICVTPYYEEPGLNVYRSVNPGEFINREPEDQIKLQNAGIIFNRDETTLETIYPKINLAVSSAFAKGDTRPNDALVHARVNADHLIRQIYSACYSQIKRNEFKRNLALLKTSIDNIIDTEIKKEYMMKGTYANVEESDMNPYQLKITGEAIPINSTLAIGFGMYLGAPNSVSDDS